MFISCYVFIQCILCMYYCSYVYCLLSLPSRCVIYIFSVPHFSSKNSIPLYISSHCSTSLASFPGLLTILPTVGKPGNEVVHHSIAYNHHCVRGHDVTTLVTHWLMVMSLLWFGNDCRWLLWHYKSLWWVLYVASFHGCVHNYCN